LSICDGRCGEAGAEESDEQVLFHGSSVEAVVELCDIASEVFAFDPMVGSEQEPLQVGQRDMELCLAKITICR
jgi:hypothetical protein